MLFWMWNDRRPQRRHSVCVLLWRLPAQGNNNTGNHSGQGDGSHERGTATAMEVEACVFATESHDRIIAATHATCMGCMQGRRGACSVSGEW